MTCATIPGTTVTTRRGAGAGAAGTVGAAGTAGGLITVGVGAGAPLGPGMTPGGAARDGTITTTTGIRPMPNAARAAAISLMADAVAPTAVWLMAAGVAHHGLPPHGALPDAALRSALRSGEGIG